MDSKEWWAPGLGAAAIAAVAAVFGRRNLKRLQSSDGVADAEDTVSRNYVGSIARREEAAQKRLEDERVVTDRLRAEIAAMRALGAARDVKVKVLMAHVLTLTRIVVENNPQEARWARESVFMDMFDESQTPPDSSTSKGS